MTDPPAQEQPEFAGRRVKRGSLLVFGPYVTHRLPELWPEPLASRPERWDTTEPGYRKSRTDEFLPFSAGRTSLHLPKQRIRPTGFAAMGPAHGLLVEVT